MTPRRLATCVATALIAACGPGPSGTAGGGPSGPAPATGTFQPSGGPSSAGASAAPSSTCASPVQASAAPPAQVQSLGAHPVGATVTFDVPPGTVSVTVIEQAVQAPASISYRPSASAAPIAIDNTAVPLQIRDASGAVLFDDLAPVPPDAATLPLVFLGSAPGTGTVTFPNSSAGLSLIGTARMAGRWSAVVSDWAYECTVGQGLPCDPPASSASGAGPSTYDVTVITKPGVNGAIPPSGALDIDVYFATAATDTPRGATPLPLSAPTANTGKDPDLNRMAQTLRALLANGGIALRSLTYHDLPADVQATYAAGVDVDATGTCSALASLLRHSGPGARLAVFFVSTFAATGDASVGQVVGIDGGIPGPSTIGGTGASGAAVAMHDLRFGRASCTGPLTLLCGADVTAYIIAHEAGHFLGLYHVTESDGLEVDPLQDSPACPCRTCATSPSTCADSTPAPAAPHQMSVAECTRSTACGGGDNLMFWLLDRGSAGALTAEQQGVIRANPLVQ